MLIYFHNSTCEHSHHYNLHQKSVPLLHSMFGSLFYPYLFKKSSKHSPLTLFSSIPQQFFTSLFLRTITPTIYTKNVFSTSAIEPIQAASWDQGAREFYETRIDSDSGDSQSLITYCSGSENWCIAGSSLGWRCLQLEWQTIQSNFSHTFNLLSILWYPTTLENSCLTWLS